MPGLQQGDQAAGTQDRKPARMETDAIPREALKTKMARYWVDMEGAIAYGHWWDAVEGDHYRHSTVTESAGHLC